MGGYGVEELCPWVASPNVAVSSVEEVWRSGDHYGGSRGVTPLRPSALFSSPLSHPSSPFRLDSQVRALSDELQRVSHRALQADKEAAR